MANKRWVFHAPTLTLGPVKRYYDGHGAFWEAGEQDGLKQWDGFYKSPVNDEEVKGAVLELHTGHALNADPAKFIEMEGREVSWYVLAQQKLTEFIGAAAQNAASRGIPEETGIVMFVALLRTQLIALEKAAGIPAPGEVLG